MTRYVNFITPMMHQEQLPCDAAINLQKPHGETMQTSATETIDLQKALRNSCDMLLNTGLPNGTNIIGRINTAVTLLVTVAPFQRVFADCLTPTRVTAASLSSLIFQTGQLTLKDHQVAFLLHIHRE